MYYYLIIALQGFCIYHSIKNRNSYYWIFLIIFIPVVGSVIYLITQVYNKRDAEKITSEISTIINPTKKVKNLEQKLQFAETYQNRVDLADAYFQLNDFKNAITHYKIALDDVSQNNFYVTKCLIASYYKLEDFDKVVYYAEQIKDVQAFKKSKTEFIYGLALHEMGQSDNAEKHLRNINQRYSNYEERLELSKFLLKKGNEEDAKEILNDIHTESMHMTKINKSKFRITILEVEKLLKSL